VLALFHPLLAVVQQNETAAQEGRKVILSMLAVGGIFLLVIAIGELSHWAAQQRRRREP
jgi:heme/copper-type cytochrome/quinol oxidase subunit 2